MIILKRILKCLFVIVFILSISLNLILAFSTTNNLIFKDSLDERIKLSLSATNNLNTNAFTAKTHTLSNNVYAEASCVKIANSTTDVSWDCQYITEAYDNNNNLIRTIYFPGDGYKYTVEGSTKKVEEFSNFNLQQQSLSLLNLSGVLAYLTADLFEDYEPHMTFDSKSHLDFKTLGLEKTITAKFDNTKTSFEYSYSFDKNDRLTKVVMKDIAYIDIFYENQDLNMPTSAALGGK